MAAGGGVPQLGGYHYEFVDEVPDKLKCAICLLPLKNPMQVTKCGHRFCKLCIDPILSNPPACCPKDRQPISADKVFEDAACEREVLELHVKCSSGRCRWSGEVRHFENHRRVCPFEQLKCENEGCKEGIARSDLRFHVTTTCQWRKVACVHCNEKLINKFAQEHNAVCKRYPLPCVNKCGQIDIPRNQMTVHVGSDCPAAVVPCKYEHVGCQVKTRRSALQDHVKISVEKHLDLACAKLKELEARQFNCVPFVWKISNFEKRQREAKLGISEGIKSDPLYTSPQGYKMRLIIYPDGYGGAKGSHLSVFIMIMKGEYDNVLTWPFQYTIEFTLIDQHEEENNRNNLSLSFTPDLTMENFKKPDSQVNEGRGFAEFVSHEVLRTRRYIVDDTIFLKVEIG